MFGFGQTGSNDIKCIEAIEFECMNWQNWL